MAGEITLGLTGDVMLGRNRDQRQRYRDPGAVWGDVLGQLESFDGLLVNLECCLSTRGEPWTRTHRPFHFRADPDWAVPALRRAGVDVATLANNHILDFREPALRDTVSSLDEAGIEHVGAGRLIDEALEPARVRIGDFEVAVVGFTDNTPEYAAGPESPGTARIEIDVDDADTNRLIDDALSRAREFDPEVLIASLHWGPNMRESPPSKHREFARSLIDRGVDVVHGHSAHVFQGVDTYRDRPIIYDAGDFVDDYATDPDLRNDRSFLFEVIVDRDDPVELRLFPTEIVDCSVRFGIGDSAEWARDRMRSLSEPFGTEFERRDEALVLALDD